MTDPKQPLAQFNDAFWDEHYETLVVSDEAHLLLPALDANIFDRDKQTKLRWLLDSPELARATKRWERWKAEAAAQSGQGAAA